MRRGGLDDVGTIPQVEACFFGVMRWIDVHQPVGRDRVPRVADGATQRGASAADVAQAG
jgi:hypothetical protein